jgi:hypothetical protein
MSGPAPNQAHPSDDRATEDREGDRPEPPESGIYLKLKDSGAR